MRKIDKNNYLKDQPLLIQQIFAIATKFISFQIQPRVYNYNVLFSVSSEKKQVNLLCNLLICKMCIWMCASNCQNEYVCRPNVHYSWLLSLSVCNQRPPGESKVAFSREW